MNEPEVMKFQYHNLELLNEWTSAVVTSSSRHHKVGDEGDCVTGTRHADVFWETLLQTLNPMGCVDLHLQKVQGTSEQAKRPRGAAGSRSLPVGSSGTNILCSSINHVQGARGVKRSQRRMEGGLMDKQTDCRVCP